MVMRDVHHAEFRREMRAEQEAEGRAAYRGGIAAYLIVIALCLLVAVCSLAQIVLMLINMAA